MTETKTESKADSVSVNARGADEACDAGKLISSNGQQCQIQEATPSNYSYSRDASITANPLTAVLPDFSSMTTRTICDHLKSEPQRTNDYANRIQRSDYLMSLATDAFFPLARHIQIHNLIVLLLKLGYKNRSIDEEADHIPTLEEVKEQYKINEPFSKTQSCLSAAVIGCSGIGKSYAIEKILGLFPRAVRHKRKGEEDFIQAIYLKVDCPADGSVKVLFTRIISELANCVRQNYADSFLNSRRITLEILMARALRLMDQHKVGLLIIDEIQNLVHYRHNHEILFNFLVSLSNTLKIPVLYVGTPKALQFFQDNLRIARRFASCGVYYWNRLIPGNNGTVGEWDEFIIDLWSHRILKNDPVLIPDDIRKTLYECSQGVIDILMKLFVLAEMRELELGRETLSVGAIKTVFNDNFQSIEPMIRALKDNDIQKINEYQDLIIPKPVFTEAMKKSRARISEIAGQTVGTPDLATDDEIIEDCLSIAAGCEYDLSNMNLIEMLHLKIREQKTGDIIPIWNKVINEISKRFKEIAASESKEKDEAKMTVALSSDLPIEDVPK